MADPFLAEIRVFSFNFAPQGWAQCNGQTMPIQQNQALYTLIGTQFGGDAKTTFNLPNLQGRVPINPSTTIPQGNSGGEATHLLTVAEMPLHTHAAAASSATPTQRSPTDAYWASVNGDTPSYHPQSSGAMAPAALAEVGGSQAHNNMQPYLVLNYCICLSGYYPPRS